MNFRIILSIGIVFLFSGCESLNKDSMKNSFYEAVNGFKKQGIRKIEGQLNPQQEDSQDFPKEYLQDAQIQQYIKSFKDKLVKVNGKEAYLDIEVLGASNIQAITDRTFSYADITITRGMLNSIENEAQLAALIGHEMGHYFLGYHFREDSSLQKAVDSRIASMSNGILKEEVLKQTTQIKDSNWNKEAEMAADRFGAELAAKAGYDPYALCDLLDHLSKMVNKDVSYRIRKIKGTHPAIDDRVLNLKGYLVLKGYKHQGILNSQDYQKAMAHLWGIKTNQGKVNDKVVSEDLKILAEVEHIIKNAKMANQPLKMDQFLQIMNKISEICKRLNITEKDLTVFNKNRSYNFLEEVLYQDSPVWGSSDVYQEQISDRLKDILNQTAQMGVGSIPVVGNAISLYEVLLGKDFFAGETLTNGQRAFSALCVFVGNGHLWKEVVRGIKQEARALKKSAQEIKEIDSSVQRASEDFEEGIEQELKYRKGEDVNAELKQKELDPQKFEDPYPLEGAVIEGVLAKETKFVRVHVEGNVERKWVMKEEDVINRTPKEIKDIFALPTEPTKISVVNLPRGVRIRVGSAGRNRFGNGGGLQYEILDLLKSDWYSLPKEIGEKLILK